MIADQLLAQRADTHRVDGVSDTAPMGSAPFSDTAPMGSAPFSDTTEVSGEA